MNNTVTTRLSSDDINTVFGRELVPGQMASTFLRAANIFSQGGSDKKSFSKIRFNTADSMTGIKLADGARPSHETATCFYMLRHTHVQKGKVGGKSHFTPCLGITVGIANNNDPLGSKSMINIMLDIRKPDDIEIEYTLAGNLGLKAPQQHDQKLAVLRLAGSWMDRIDNGETLDPVECRQQIKSATGLADDTSPGICPETGLNNQLSRLSAPYAAQLREERSVKAGTRIKQLYAMGRTRNTPAP